MQERKLTVYEKQSISFFLHILPAFNLKNYTVGLSYIFKTLKENI